MKLGTALLRCLPKSFATQPIAFLRACQLQTAQWSSGLVSQPPFCVCKTWWLAGPRKAKPDPRGPPASPGDQPRQQSSMSSRSAADVSRNNPSAIKKQHPRAADKHLLAVMEVFGQQRQDNLLNTAANPQLGTARVRSNQSTGRDVDSCPDGSRHTTNSHSSSSQKTRSDLASTSGSPESRTQRLKQRVLTGSPATTFTHSSAASNQPQKGSSTYPPGSQPPLHLSRNLDRLGTLSHQLSCLQVCCALLRDLVVS